MRARRGIPAALLLSLLLAPTSASPDVLHLRDGGSLRGKITPKAESVVVETPAWRAEIPRERILRIDKEPDPIEAYAKRRAGLPAAPSADDWTNLGAWCASSGLDAQAREAWAEAIRIAPDHEGARRALGYVRWQDRWVTEDEFHAAQGEVKFRGRWIPREEMTAILDSEKAAREAREWAGRSEQGKREAAAAERRLEDAANDAAADARRAEAEARRREAELRRQQEEAAARLETRTVVYPGWFDSGIWGYPYGWPPRYVTPYGSRGGWVTPYGWPPYTVWGWGGGRGAFGLGGTHHGTGTRILIR